MTTIQLLTLIYLSIAAIMCLLFWLISLRQLKQIKTKKELIAHLIAILLAAAFWPLTLAVLIGYNTLVAINHFMGLD